MAVLSIMERYCRRLHQGKEYMIDLIVYNKYYDLQMMRWCYGYLISRILILLQRELKN